MATFTVNTASDIVNAGDSLLSLREALEQANNTAAADSIVFAPSIEGETLVLTGGQLFVNNATTIDGDQNNDGVRVSIDGNDADRIFRVVGESSFSDLRLFNGHVDSNEDGGALLILGSIDVSINNCVVEGSEAGEYGDYGDGRGGAVFVQGSNLTIVQSKFSDNYAYNAAAIGIDEATVNLRSSILTDHHGYFVSSTIGIWDGHLTLENTGIIGNSGSAISANESDVFVISSQLNSNSRGFRASYSYFNVSNSTIADNSLSGPYSQDGASAYIRDGMTIIRNSTITGNVNDSSSGQFSGYGGGILARSGFLELDNTILAGNFGYDGSSFGPSDLLGTINLSNGHNIFGSDVQGNVEGDRENIAAAAIFAAIDPDTGGGQLNTAGVVPLRANVANPAQAGSDRFLIGSTDQVGNPRPAPTGTNPDVGSVESGFTPSKVSSPNNDALTGTAAANTLNGQGGNDFLKGLGGNDTLNGGDGADFLEGGTGNDKINGGTATSVGAGIDIANYGDSGMAVTVDLRGDAPSDKDTAKRGSEADTLTSIEGAITGGGNDRFFGDNSANWFQGGRGKDTFTGGSGRDLYDYNLATATPVGGGRDVITDFDHLTDDIDLMGIDASSTVAGNQAFRFVGAAALSGSGEVGFFTSGGNTIIRLSTDADSTSEAEIQLTGMKTLTALDFYL